MRGSCYKIPETIFYLLKGDYRFSHPLRLEGLGFWVSGAPKRGISVMGEYKDLKRHGLGFSKKP